MSRFVCSHAWCRESYHNIPLCRVHAYTLYKSSFHVGVSPHSWLNLVYVKTQTNHIHVYGNTLLVSNCIVIQWAALCRGPVGVYKAYAKDNGCAAPAYGDTSPPQPPIVYGSYPLHSMHVCNYIDISSGIPTLHVSTVLYPICRVANSREHSTLYVFVLSLDTLTLPHTMYSKLCPIYSCTM